MKHTVLFLSSVNIRERKDKVDLVIMFLLKVLPCLIFCHTFNLTIDEYIFNLTGSLVIGLP